MPTGTSGVIRAVLTPIVIILTDRGMRVLVISADETSNCAFPRSLRIPTEAGP
jgi:hypothetical protein